jgi:hypothetical protein
MILTLRPVGRGNWKTVTIRIEGTRALPLLVSVNDRIPLGGITYRIVKVQA